MVGVDANVDPVQGVRILVRARAGDPAARGAKNILRWACDVLDRHGRRSRLQLEQLSGVVELGWQVRHFLAGNDVSDGGVRSLQLEGRLLTDRHGLGSLADPQRDVLGIALVYVEGLAGYVGCLKSRLAD